MVSKFFPSNDGDNGLAEYAICYISSVNRNSLWANFPNGQELPLHLGEVACFLPITHNSSDIPQSFKHCSNENTIPGNPSQKTINLLHAISQWVNREYNAIKEDYKSIETELKDANSSNDNLRSSLAALNKNHIQSLKTIQKLEKRLIEELSIQHDEVG